MPEISKLQKLYVQEASMKLKYNLNRIISTEHPKNIDNLQIKEGSFFISNYALGELKKEWQNFYIDKIIKKCKHGYICWNFSVDNKKIHESFGNRSLEPRQSIVPVTLNEGWNSIILKIVNSSGPWGLSCRIRGRNGDPIDELKIDSGQKIKR